ncbi:unnamed protein product [Ranitomeya imitator]|uniref:Aconitase/3-isopropylmalate dehydratase large subunit alpha/beta/alpha domain-containing protein n=1 Tax=Ranitomeya imitator TaxID=111125 RepID=A0ABN9L7F5_9NEOB|nr:unnamed protein product [Ranitomeya imitator]
MRRFLPKFGRKKNATCCVFFVRRLRQKRRMRRTTQQTKTHASPMLNIGAHDACVAAASPDANPTQTSITLVKNIIINESNKLPYIHPSGLFGRRMSNPFQHLVEPLNHAEPDKKFYNLQKLNDARYARLPFSIRVLLESAIRNCDGFLVKRTDVDAILNWKVTQNDNVEVPFRPARVILQDFTGVPAVVDFAAMRDAVKRLGGNPEKINPVCPADLVIDHSIQVDFNRREDSLQKNQELEFERNRERFEFLKWGSQAFQNMRIIPPGSGIIHQVNLEYLARVVFDQDGFYYPDSLVGTDSHTTMIDGLGVLGWGVGGIEAEAVMLGQPISMVLPEVIGYKLFGNPNHLVTSTDIVLTVTKHLRQVGVVGKFLSFLALVWHNFLLLTVPLLPTCVRSMVPLQRFSLSIWSAFSIYSKPSRQAYIFLSREEDKVKYIQMYLEAVGLFRDFSNTDQDPDFTQVIELDLSTVVPCCSGPKRPQDKVSVSDMKTDFESCLGAKQGFKGFHIPQEHHNDYVKFAYNNADYELTHGCVVIAAITSCTNTSNPSVMLGAGLLAKNAVEAGLTVKPYIKTSLSPGSGVVTYYLRDSGVMPYLSKLGFDVVGYGCMTCIGNSGPLPESVVEAITQTEPENPPLQESLQPALTPLPPHHYQSYRLTNTEAPATLNLLSPSP